MPTESKAPSGASARIRQGIVQFIGAMAKEMKGDPKDAKQLIAASLVEEAISLALKKNGEIDSYVTKPVLRGALYLLNKRNAGIRETSKKLGIWENVRDQVQEAETVANHLKKIINNTTKDKGVGADDGND